MVISGSSLPASRWFPSCRAALVLARRCRIHDTANRINKLRPPIPLARQLGLPHHRQPVVLRPLPGLADAPLGLQPPALLEAVQGGVEGAGFDLEHVVGLRANGLADAVAVLGPPLKGPKDEHVECALEELQAPFVWVHGHSRRQSTTLDAGRLRLVPPPVPSV